MWERIVLDRGPNGPLLPSQGRGAGYKDNDHSLLRQCLTHGEGEIVFPRGCLFGGGGLLALDLDVLWRPPSWGTILTSSGRYLPLPSSLCSVFSNRDSGSPAHLAWSESLEQHVPWVCCHPRKMPPGDAYHTHGQARTLQRRHSARSTFSGKGLCWLQIMLCSKDTLGILWQGVCYPSLVKASTFRGKNKGKIDVVLVLLSLGRGQLERSTCFLRRLLSSLPGAVRLLGSCSFCSSISNHSCSGNWSSARD